MQLLEHSPIGKVYHILARIAAFCLVLLLSVTLAVQYPVVQKRVTDELLERITSSIDGRVSVGEVQLHPFNAVLLKDVVIIDGEPFHKDEEGWIPVDTLFTAELITATVSLRNFVKSEGLHFGRLYVENSMLHIVSEPGERFHDNMSRLFKFPKPPEVPVEKGKVFDASKVRVKNFRFRLSDGVHPRRPHDGTSINWQDMDLVAQLRGHNLRLAGSRMSGVVDDLSATEKCGYSFTRATGRTRVGMGRTEVSHMRFRDKWSDLRINSYTMSYRNARAFKHFLDEVKLSLKLGRGTVLSMRSLHAFTGFPKDIDSKLLIDDCNAGGYVNDMAVKTLRFTEMDSGVSGTLSGKIMGLPDIDRAYAELDARSLKFTTSSLDRMIASFSKGKSLGIGKYAPGRTLTLDAKAKGTLRKLALDAKLGSRIGNVRTRMDILDLLSKKGMRLSGTVGCDELQVGTVSGISELGNLTMRSGIRAHLAKGEPSIIVDSLKIDKMGALGYDYSNIAAAGRFSGSSFDGKLICDDPNLNFIFQGIFNLSRRTSNALYKFYANLGYADLNALQLYKNGDAKLSGQMFANFMRISEGDLIGDIDITGLALENEEGLQDIGNISIGSHSNDEVHRIQFNSSFADGGYVGSKPITALLEDIQNVTTRRDLPALYKDARPSGKQGTSELEFNFHDSYDILSFLVPGLYIADGTAMALNIDRRGVLSGYINPPRIAYGQNYFKGLDLRVDDLDRSLNCILTGEEIRLSQLGFKDGALTAYAEDNNFALGFHYDNISGNGNQGELYLTGELYRDETDTLVVRAKPLYSYIKFNGEQWDIAESDIRLRAGDLTVKDFSVANGQQMLLVDGGLSAHRPDTLNVSVENFDLSTIDNFLARPLDLAGTATGKGSLYSPGGISSGLDAKLLCNAVSIAGYDVGNLDLDAAWDAASEQYAVELRNTSAGREPLFARGYYSPSDGSMDASVVLRQFGLAPARPFLADALEDFGGSVSGSFTISGTPDSLSIGSIGAQLEDVYATIAYTGASYNLGGPFYLDDKEIFLEEIAISDAEGGSGTLFGSINFSESVPAVDLNLDFTDLKMMDKEDGNGRSPYGNFAASGSVHAAGPFDALGIDVDASSSDDGRIHVPLGGYAVSSSGHILTFKKLEQEEILDPYEERMLGARRKGRVAMDVAVKAKVTASEGLEALLEIDKSTGNVMAIRGNGLVNLDIRPSSDIFTVNGDYNITGGHYHFVALGLANRDFDIREGSSIKFNGDLMDSDLDVDAVYNLKTSLSTLLADTTSVSTRRNVECGISITDKIANPRLAFSINIPDLDPTTKSLVESALNTEDKIQRQFVALLLTGTFLPAEQSGIVNNTDMLYSNVSEIMSNQLNNILQRLSIPVDLGLGYHPNDNGTDIFDVAVSTQLFNNRVVVNGTIGNRQYSTTTNPNGDVVGDLDIEVKLDKPGKFRLNLFSHSADEYTNYLDYSQRNGVGLTYQKEYNKFGDFLRSIFTRKKKRGDEDSQAMKPEEEELVTIEIDE